MVAGTDGGRRRGRPHASLLALVVLAGLLPGLVPGPAQALPGGFRITTVISGLSEPTSVRFAQDGRVFVAEKSGLIKVFDGLGDTTPDLFADLSTNVYSYFDRGLLGIELHPQFPAVPHVYALYTYDAEIGGTAPRWGTPGVLSDPCPDPPGGTTNGCIASARLSRLQASGNAMVGSEQVLIEDWCQQFPSHSIGTVRFGPDGALYVGAGEGAIGLDWGQKGDPVNPCGDPPGGVGGVMQPPSAEGGSLRSQDLRTPSDPTTLDGTIIRVDPDTGAALPDNPFAGSPDPNARRVIAYGLRNPFRFTFRPGTSEIWAADVGESTWEEIDRIQSPTDATVENFGWPCYEGTPRHPGWDTRDFTICEQLYAEPFAVPPPYFAYRHGNPVSASDTCRTGGGVISAIGFYGGGSYPAAYDGALFFGDYQRGCIWVMYEDQSGNLAPSSVQTFATDVGFPVELEIGPGGDLFFVNVFGSIRRIEYFATNQPPAAVLGAAPTFGAAPLTVAFDGTGSSDPEGGPLTYEWDLDGDGAYDDSTAPAPTYEYQADGDYTARLRVTDPEGAQGTASRLISVGNDPPTAVIDMPAPSLTWRVGDEIAFSGRGTDPQDGDLPPSALTWSLALDHCTATGVCHEHFLQDFAGQASGSFPAPDHEYPAHLTLRLSVTDSRGLSDTASVRLDPETASLTLGSDPAGLQLGLNAETAAAPFTRTVIAGSGNSLTAPSPQSLGGTAYEFSSWSDGGARTHDVTVAGPTASYTATFVPAASVEVVVRDFEYVPRNLELALGLDVLWRFDGPSPHTVTDNSGMGLYDSGVLGPGATYSLTFSAAGRYPYRSTVDSNMTGSVWVPMVLTPISGGTSTAFSIRWATAPPPPGYAFDVQILRPSSSTWVSWRYGSTATDATFVPDAGAGQYQFRARLRRTATGRSTAYSSAASIQVSAGAVNAPPDAVLWADPTSGSVPLTVSFDATGSTDPDGDALTYAWDLDGDGALDDATVARPTHVYETPGNYLVTLRVTDPQGASDTATVVIGAQANAPPSATIDAPLDGRTWRVGEMIEFSGHADDPEDGALPASALSWSVLLRHCPGTCHTHDVATAPGVAGGAFVVPDHTYPTTLEVRLTATDSGGLQGTAARMLDPLTAALTLDSDPPGLSLTLNGESAAAPFTRTAIVGSTNAVEAPSPQALGGSSYEFSSWSDGGARAHQVVAGEAAATYLATFALIQDTAFRVVVRDFEFDPRTALIGLGQDVRWDFQGPSDHRVVDNSGMGLFDSGVRAAGTTYGFTFAAAGRYPVACAIHTSITGSVQVPAVVTPATGGTSTTFTIAWASAPPPSGFAFDVQLKRPGATAWSNWLVGTSLRETTYTPGAGPGTYEFRARIRNTANNRASAYSAPATAMVS